MWDDLRLLANHMTDAWCVLGDFNDVLSHEDRIGGEDVQYMEMVDFKRCLEETELTELKTTGAYYTWTNRSIWSKIDRLLLTATGLET